MVNDDASFRKWFRKTCIGMMDYKSVNQWGMGRLWE